jgi:cysteine synthase A
VEEATRRLTVQRNAFRADQFRNQGNVHAHEYHTAEEMWEQAAGQIDAFVDFSGSGGTFVGCAKGLKKHKPDIRCYLIEPKSAAYLAGKTVSNRSHKVQGGGYSMELPFLERSLVHDYLQISDEEAINTTRELAKREGIFAGFCRILFRSECRRRSTVAPRTGKGRQHCPHHQ